MSGKQKKKSCKENQAKGGSSETTTGKHSLSETSERNVNQNSNTK
jgi:hypothetical protein